MNMMMQLAFSGTSYEELEVYCLGFQGWAFLFSYIQLISENTFLFLLDKRNHSYTFVRCDKYHIIKKI